MSFDGYPANSFDGIPGIDAEVGQKLINLRGIHLYGHRPVSRQPGQVDIFTNQPAQHFKYALHCLVEIEGNWGNSLLSGKGQKLPGYFRGTNTGFVDFTEVFIKLISGIEPLPVPVPR